MSDLSEPPEKPHEYHPLDNTEPLWTIEDVALYLCLRPETVRLMARRGQLPGFKVGRSWRFRMVKIKEYLAQKMDQQQ